MFKFSVIFLVLLNSAIAAPKVGIIKVFDQFVVSSAVIGSCEKPNQEIVDNFFVNFKAVLMYTQLELEKKYPAVTKNKIQKIISSNINRMRLKTQKIVDKEGCDNPGIQEIIKLFYVQANWKPYKK
jgi:hypothetical protein